MMWAVMLTWENEDECVLPFAVVADLNVACGASVFGGGGGEGGSILFEGSRGADGNSMGGSR
jgi:hypothetical protein